METFKTNYLPLLFLAILAYCSILYPLLVESCNPIDEEALLKFKGGIEYGAQYQLATWIPKTNCCATWYGVECDAANGRVVRLSPFRPANPMDVDISVFVNGTLSPFLGNLTYLQVLDLFHFQENYLSNPDGLRGPIPPQLGMLSHLTSLHLGANILNGSIPTSFANLHKLQFLYLGHNRLSGSIPNIIFRSMKSLSTLSLAGNNFTCSIPSSFMKKLR
ncbi:hypothetical protein BVRB_013590 [Beta vulgaris subsp. vulgaris]|uniref:Leucine-rich repeat-containing N-terminal plant-type domain-containing protein n=1 Tax=Beta vulgaris subsp. vulgaris TaxID=3555 RepID=A0A0J8DVT8_BETVV|nr:hypothetical protein BVRB_013590 [Beta vulgaris subsp. vulgaris]